jgi:hypothetical protein
MKIFRRRSIDPDKLADELIRLSKHHSILATGPNISANLVETLIAQILSEIAIAVKEATK